jgi:hypothetical protein
MNQPEFYIFKEKYSDGCWYIYDSKFNTIEKKRLVPDDDTSRVRRYINSKYPNRLQPNEKTSNDLVVSAPKNCKEFFSYIELRRKIFGKNSIELSEIYEFADLNVPSDYFDFTGLKTKGLLYMISDEFDEDFEISVANKSREEVGNPIITDSYDINISFHKVIELPKEDENKSTFYNNLHSLRIKMIEELKKHYPHFYFKIYFIEYLTYNEEPACNRSFNDLYLEKLFSKNFMNNGFPLQSNSMTSVPKSRRLQLREAIVANRKKEKELKILEQYYLILGLTVGASDEQIKNAYKSQLLKWHPDKNIGTDTTDINNKINEAYAILKDSESRNQHIIKMVNKP